MNDTGTDPVSRGSETLFLTLTRSSQRGRYTDVKNELRGKRFSIRDETPTFCKTHKIAFLRRENNQTIIRFDRIPCNSWTCPACVFIKANKVKNLLRTVAIINNLQYFLTLTLSPDQIPLEYRPKGDNLTHKYITKLFNTLLTNIRRDIVKEFDEKETLKYLWVIQFQKNGNAHLHILLSTRLPIIKVREIWERIGGGKIMYIEKVENIDSAAAYISEYLVTGIKESKTYSWFHYFERRYTISRSCTRPSHIITPLYQNSPPRMQVWVNLYKKKQDWLFDMLESDFEDGKEITVNNFSI